MFLCIFKQHLLTVEWMLIYHYIDLFTLFWSFFATAEYGDSHALIICMKPQKDILKDLSLWLMNIYKLLG